MKKIYLNLIKSILLAIIIIFLAFFLLGQFLNGDDAGVFIIGIAIIFTVIFCTYQILEDNSNEGN